jgi:hypothetical protein
VCCGENIRPRFAPHAKWQKKWWQSGLHAAHSTRQGAVQRESCEKGLFNIFATAPGNYAILLENTSALNFCMLCWLVNFLLWQTERFDKKPSVSRALLSQTAVAAAAHYLQLLSEWLWAPFAPLCQASAAGDPSRLEIN